MLRRSRPAASTTAFMRSRARSTWAAGSSGIFPLAGSLPDMLETNNRSAVSTPGENGFRLYRRCSPAGCTARTLRQIAYRDGTDLNRWFGKFGNAEHRPCGRSLRFGKDLGEDLVHLCILADVLEINLGINHVLHGQTRSLDNRFDVVEACRACAAKVAGKLPSGRRGPCPETYT